jgi:hypothetical protein
MKQQLPQWRIDNLFPIAVIFLTWAFSFGILYTKVEMVIKSQELQYTMWLQLEKRVGNTELSIATNNQFNKEVKNILKLQ